MRRPLVAPLVSLGFVIASTAPARSGVVTGTWTWTIDVSWCAYSSSGDPPAMFGTLPDPGTVVGEVATATASLQDVGEGGAVTLPLPVYGDAVQALPSETFWLLTWGPIGVASGNIDPGIFDITMTATYAGGSSLTIDWACPNGGGGVCYGDDPDVEVFAVAVRPAPGGGTSPGPLAGTHGWTINSDQFLGGCQIWGWGDPAAFYGSFPAAGSVISETATAVVQYTFGFLMNASVNLPLPTYGDGSTAAPSEVLWLVSWGPIGTEQGYFAPYASGATIPFHATYSGPPSASLFVTQEQDCTPRCWDAPDIEVFGVALRTGQPTGVEGPQIRLDSFGRVKARYRE